MRALTLTPPWTGVVAAGLKLVENRDRSIIRREDFGKPFALHAGRKVDAKVFETIYRIAPELRPDPAMGCAQPRWYQLSQITSAVIAIATVVDVVFDRSGLLVSDIRRQLGPQSRWWFADQYGYVLRDIVTLATPVPCRGWQGFWTLPQKIERAVAAQIAGPA